MYKLEYLSLAKSDMDGIIYYISYKLANKSAATKLALNFINCANSILDFPYSNPVHHYLGALRLQYRSIRVQNFLMFYTINEEKKLITIF